MQLGNWLIDWVCMYGCSQGDKLCTVSSKEGRENWVGVVHYSLENCVLELCLWRMSSFTRNSIISKIQWLQYNRRVMGFSNCWIWRVGWTLSAIYSPRRKEGILLYCIAVLLYYWDVNNWNTSIVLTCKNSNNAYQSSPIIYHVL